jgi:hypothetical protein
MLTCAQRLRQLSYLTKLIRCNALNAIHLSPLDFLISLLLFSFSYAAVQAQRPE